MSMNVGRFSLPRNGYFRCGTVEIPEDHSPCICLQNLESGMLHNASSAEAGGLEFSRYQIGNSKFIELWKSGI